MSTYLLPELAERSLDPGVFPLLPDGREETFLCGGFSYPRSVRIFDESVPLFSGGIVTSLEVNQIAEGVARAICERHRGKSILIVTVLEGALPFANLVEKNLRSMEMEGSIRLSFSSLKVSSYKTGSRALRHEIVSPLTERGGEKIKDLSCYDAVIILDDLIDSGETIFWLASHYLPSFGVREKEAYFMLEKRVRRPVRSRGEIDLIVPVIGKKVPDDWVVGFGLDLAMPEAVPKVPRHLFREALPGGIYAFNAGIEKGLIEFFRKDPEKIRKQLGVYLSEK